MRFVLTLTALLFATFTMAQQPSTILAAQSDLRFRNGVEKTFLQYEASLATHCTEIYPDWSKATYVVYVPPTQDAQGQLLRASWSQSVPGTACGQPRRFRALVTVRDGRTGISRQLPGTSNISAALEQDVRIGIVGAAANHLSPAKLDPSPFDVLDTSLVGDILPAAGQSWREVWLISIGGRHMKVPIRFVPDPAGSGTSFHIDPKTIENLP